MSKCIIVVEDTAALRTSIVELLRMEEYTVSFANQGKEALTLLEKTKADLIITDLLMSEMNGFDFIARVRENPPWKGIPILVFSAMPAHENEEKVLHMGANFYLKKPSTLERLLEVVNNLIK